MSALTSSSPDKSSPLTSSVPKSPTSSPSTLLNLQLPCCSLLTTSKSVIIGHYVLEPDSTPSSTAQNVPQNRTGGWTVLTHSLEVLSYTPSQGGVLSSVFHQDERFGEVVVSCCSDGTLRYFDYVKGEVVRTVVVKEGGVMTDLCWFNEDGWIVTWDDGRFCYVKDDGGGVVWSGDDGHVFHGVPMEVWCVECLNVRCEEGGGNGGFLVTGGDDMKLRLWRYESGDDDGGGFASAGVLGGFEGGVTRVEQCPARDHLVDRCMFEVIVGSYDESIRLVRWNVEMGGKEVLWRVDVGGGVWRLERLRVEGGRDVWLAGVMYGGAIAIYGDDGGVVEGSKNTGFDSMVYGAGWIRGDDEEEGESWRMVACSFYDMKVRVWGNIRGQVG